MSYYGQDRTAHARVGSSVLSTIEKSPSWPGNYNEALTVTDWILKLTLVCVYRICYGHHHLARALSEFCIVHNRKVAMLAWKLKWPLNGDRLDFEVNMGLCVWNLLWATGLLARARSESSELPTIEKSAC